AGPPPWMAEMDTYFREIAARRQVAPEEDLITDLIAAEIEGERLADQEFLSFCSLLLAAGHVTTSNLIANAVLCLIHPAAAMARLRANPSLLPGTIEEVLRYRCPVQAPLRLALVDLELGGQQIHAGQPLIAWVGAANRDEARFPNAEEFWMDRHPNPHIAFGFGIHFCLGVALARLE